jgi:hypothetical protein
MPWLKYSRCSSAQPDRRALFRVRPCLRFRNVEASIPGMNGRPYISGLLYPQMKTDRAAAQLQQLRHEVRAFRTGNPYTVTKEDEAQRGLHIVRIQLNPASPDIPVLIGEFAYSLRSALDHLAWQLGLLSSRAPSRHSTFPILSTNRAEDRRRFKLATRDIPSEAVDIIKTLQPYLRGDAMKSDPLWQLNKLCNLDKHVTVGYSHTLVQVGVVTRPGEPRPLVISDEESQVTEVRIPLAKKHHVEIKPQPPELVFGKPIDAPGEDFELSEENVTEIHRFVGVDVLPRFARFFANIGPS